MNQNDWSLLMNDHWMEINSQQQHLFRIISDPTDEKFLWDVRNGALPTDPFRRRRQAQSAGGCVGGNDGIFNKDTDIYHAKEGEYVKVQ
eukprot:Pgem_evm1s15797